MITTKHEGKRKDSPKITQLHRENTNMLNRLVYKQLSNLILYLYSEIDEDGRINTNKDLQTSKHYKIINNVDPFCYRPFVLRKVRKIKRIIKVGKPRQNRINNQTMLLTLVEMANTKTTIVIHYLFQKRQLFTNRFVKYTRWSKHGRTITNQLKCVDCVL